MSALAIDAAEVKSLYQACLSHDKTREKQVWFDILKKTFEIKKQGQKPLNTVVR